MKHFSECTIKSYVFYANKFIHSNSVEDFLEYYRNKSNSTQRLAAFALISFLRYKKIEHDIYLPKRTIVLSSFISYDDYKFFIKKYKRSLKKLIVIKLLFETGIRSSELLAIKQSDIKENSIIINGKGKKQRMVFISNELKLLINKKITQSSFEKIFDYSYKNLYQIVRRLSKNKKITPHMFRRGYAKYCYEKGVSIYDISLTMGHSSVETTSNYIKRSSEDINISYLFESELS